MSLMLVVREPIRKHLLSDQPKAGDSDLNVDITDKQSDITDNESRTSNDALDSVNKKANGKYLANNEGKDTHNTVQSTSGLDGSIETGQIATSDIFSTVSTVPDGEKKSFHDLTRKKIKIEVESY